MGKGKQWEKDKINFMSTLINSLYSLPLLTPRFRRAFYKRSSPRIVNVAEYITYILLFLLQLLSLQAPDKKMCQLRKLYLYLCL